MIYADIEKAVSIQNTICAITIIAAITDENTLVFIFLRGSVNDILKDNPTVRNRHMPPTIVISIFISWQRHQSYNPKENNVLNAKAIMHGIILTFIMQKVIMLEE